MNPTIQPAVPLPTSFVQRDVPCEFVGIANFDLKNIQFTPNHSGNLLLPAKKPAPRRRKAGQAGTRKRVRRNPVAGKPPWLCDYPGCGAIINCNRRYDIERHLKTHLPKDMREFRCERKADCKYSSWQKNNRDVHHDVHNEKLCDVGAEDGTPCGFVGINAGILNQHRQRVHGWPKRSPRPGPKGRRRNSPSKGKASPSSRTPPFPTFLHPTAALAARGVLNSAVRWD
ncbi:hypothetical protein EW026_g5523 [Hermanssonia centrifuga]|uniref:C2H2-type domain-containing protein n=1 Tax=Hermanssonia centrifuga TaxID=98765 RepID=A0A4S4KFN4_9APHY|nr:hypothetical protein EW026_g5523 [Hermanssonia centrifuga]